MIFSLKPPNLLNPDKPDAEGTFINEFLTS